MVHVFLKQDGEVPLLYIKAPFEQKDACKAVLGARWQRERKAWTYPASEQVVEEIHRRFPDAAWSGEAQPLLRAAMLRADAIRDGQRIKAAHALPDLPVYKTVPWLHQKQGFWFARQLPAAMLAMDMGTGKTKVAVDLLVNRACSRVLVLCPKSVVPVWPSELERHSTAPWCVAALTDGQVRKRVQQIAQTLDLAKARRERAAVIVNYEAAWREDMKALLLKTPWDAVILDESHRIKAPGGKASMLCSKLGDRAPLRLCLTGTPMPHSPMDLYSQYRFLDKGIFGTNYTLYRARYAIMGGFGGHEVQGFQRQDELHEKMYRIAFRVQAEDVLDLPEHHDIVRPVTLAEHTMRLYRTLDAECCADVEQGTITAANALTRLLRLQQLTGGWVQTDPNIKTGAPGELRQVDDGKQVALHDLLEDLPEREPVIVFCRFHHDLDAVHAVAEALGRSSAELSGRRNELETWKHQDGPLILAVQEQSGGVGVDFTRARYCVYYSLTFSLGDYEQSRKRVHRPGQTRTVTYFHLVASGTVDDTVYGALATRKDVINHVLDMMKKGGAHGPHQAAA